MYNLVPGALVSGFGGGALHLQSQRKCQVRLNRARISVPNESGGSGEKLVGEGNSKMVQRGPISKHTACVLAVRLPGQYISPILSRNSSKEIASPNICDRHERSSVETKDCALKELILTNWNYFFLVWFNCREEGRKRNIIISVCIKLSRNFEILDFLREQILSKKLGESPRTGNTFYQVSEDIQTSRFSTPPSCAFFGGSQH